MVMEKIWLREEKGCGFLTGSHERRMNEAKRRTSVTERGLQGQNIERTRALQTLASERGRRKE
jgi:hypothetical protein